VRTRISFVVCLLTIVAFAVPAVAQRPSDPAPAQAAPQKLDPKACKDSERSKLQGDTHETQGAAGPKDSLSDKLARTDGVICPPPDIDPDLHQPSPGGGKMPVIPPPGSPGGDPSVQPK
jgi:hypothetical protein